MTVKHVTLVEMLVVVTILAMVTGVIAISVKRSLEDQRFRTEVALVVDTLRLAQDLMLILQDDVHVKFSEDRNKGIKFWIETDSPLSKNWVNIIKRSHKTLTSVHSVDFRDELIGTTRKGEVDIKFLSGGSVMSRGVMRLANTDDAAARNALRAAVCLYGYPHPIASVSEREYGAVCLFGKDEQYNTQLTENTVRQVTITEEEEENEEEETTDTAA